MPERRMFAKTIIDSDGFLDLPPTAQLLYFHLAMRADDDGFVNKPRSVIRECGLSAADMDALVRENYLIVFDSGVVAIRHWRVHNYIQKDRYKSTMYTEEKSKITLDENKVYTLDTPCTQSVSKVDTQDRIGQDRLGQVSLDKDRTDEDSTAEEQSVVLSSSEKENVDDKGLGLSSEQCAELAGLSSVSSVEKYLEKLSRWQKKNGKRCRDPYSTIKQWIAQDKARASPAPAAYPSSDDKPSFDLSGYEEFALSLDFSKLKK